MFQNLGLLSCFFQLLLIVCSESSPSEAFTFEEAEDRIASLKALVKSPQNRAIFSLLENSEDAFYDPSVNILGTLQFVKHHSYQTQPYVANGYFGARIPKIGHGFAHDSSPNSSSSGEELKNGWPLFNKRFAGAFVAGFFNSQKNTTGNNFPWLYQYGWDSVISAIPQWTYLSISAEGYALDPERPPKTWGKVGNYVQNLSLEHGIVSTSFTWLGKLQVQYEISANKHNINLGAISLTVQNPSTEAIYIAVNDTLDFRSAQRCSFVSSRVDGHEGIQMVVTPNGLRDVFGAIHSKLYLEGDHEYTFRSRYNSLDVSQAFEIKILPGERLKFVKSVGIYTTDLNSHVYNSSEAVSSAAKKITIEYNADESDQLHKEAWMRSIGRSSSIEFPDSPLLTMASKASVYHINANMREGASGLSSALSVSGLSSDSYGGQVFWDTDLWMSMGIMPFNPAVSKSLLNYRVYGHGQAVENLKSPSRPKSTFEGAIFPWTSGRFGNCTATGPCFDYEYHINAAIAYSAIQLYLSGSADEFYLESVVYPIVHDAALLFSTYLEYDEELSQYVSKNLTDPDEFAEHIDNGAYTNAAISLTIRWAIIIAKHLGKTIPHTFEKILDNIHLPYSPDDKDVVLEYTGMNSSISVKQADVIMITYPLGNELITEKMATKNVNYYATRQVSTGPAMTFSIFSIVSSATIDTGCSSESYLLKSIQPFLRGPFAQFSEQSDDHYETNGGTHPAFPFLTAHGGFLQTILMGLLGMRFSYELEGDKIQRILVFNAKQLSLFPNGVSFGEVQYMNTSLSIILDKSGLTVKSNGPITGVVEPCSNIKIVSTSDQGKEVRVLEPSETVTFNISPRSKTDPHSLTECISASVVNLSAGAQGDVVDSIHDGDNSTYWQAESREEAQILINLKGKKVVKGGFINWGNLPARKLKIYAGHEYFGFDEEQHLELQNFTDLAFRERENLEYSPIPRDLDDKNCVFREVFTDDVLISEPFDHNEYFKVQPTKGHNITEFEFPFSVECSLILIKFSEAHDSDSNGAKVYDVSFYEA
ncbi:hypothetical protein JCM33374_g548 [Metschnikowia sp. JCM 33374]|nr:hypothetical protein JCM33374_g548 [Metschnikowia sp. JCM 33374]